jgi:hypothetical protein
VKRSDGSKVLWCLCACDKKEPTIIVEKDGHQIMQLPQAKQFQTSPSWPPELCALFEEASKSFAAGAYTSATMVCRKLLMSCACHEQSLAGQTVEEGKTFVYYVDYIVNSVLTFPRAKTAIDKIRDIGNEANHHVAIVNPVDAERSMTIIQYMLNAIYALPSA